MSLKTIAELQEILITSYECEFDDDKLTITRYGTRTHKSITEYHASIRYKYEFYRVGELEKKLSKEGYEFSSFDAPMFCTGYSVLTPDYWEYRDNVFINSDINGTTEAGVLRTALRLRLIQKAQMHLEKEMKTQELEAFVLRVSKVNAEKNRLAEVDSTNKLSHRLVDRYNITEEIESIEDKEE